MSQRVGTPSEHSIAASNHIIKARTLLAEAEATTNPEREYAKLIHAANEHERAARELRYSAHAIARTMSRD